MAFATDRLTAGGAIFTRLRALGIDYVFANSGTDFPPVIEGLAEAAAKNIDLPKAVVIPHEHAAMGMAHGYYLVTGKAQAVMLHTNVGLSNGATGAINAACENIPMLIMSGRTPVTEADRFGARTVPIAWGQEMRDQAALVRESCKWEYELRFPEQIGPLLDRASAIANSTPRGPVYLSLPREVLCETVAADGLLSPPMIAPVTGGPNPADIETAARWIAEAKSPLVIAQRGSGDERSFAAFAQWAEEWGIAVSSWWATHLAISTEHPCHVGPDPGPFLDKADVVVILNALAPWWPDRHALRDEARVINIGPDPIFSRFPVRNFRSDLTIATELSLGVPALADAMKKHKGNRRLIADRRRKLAGISADIRRAQEVQAQRDVGRGITKAYVSHCLGEALRGMTSSVFSELGTQLGILSREDYRSWFQEPHSGGLGWSFPAALGAKLGDPQRLCVATMGDGSYMFANPTVCHQIAESLGLAVLVIVLNNREWGAVRASVKGLYPDGFAASANEMPLTALTPSPDFTLTASASRAWVRKVDDPEALPAALAEAIGVVQKERRQAFVEIATLPD
jgi:acetolactate synthase I/II/III large subunit